MRIKKCTICGKEFESHYGREVCSDFCYQERLKQQWGKANARRKLKIKESYKQCPICGEMFVTIRDKYCGEACAKKARKELLKKYNAEYYKDVTKKKSNKSENL